MIQKLQSIPEPWLISITLLLLPLSIGLGVKLTQADSFSFKHAGTEINLGQIKEAVKESDELVQEQQEQIQTLVEAHEKLAVSAKKKKIVLPELTEVEEAIAESENLVEDQQENQEQLEELVDQ
jgi:enoyl-CoA hydratase/carnithine racemase